MLSLLNWSDLYPEPTVLTNALQGMGTQSKVSVAAFRVNGTYKCMVISSSDYSPPPLTHPTVR